MLRRVTQPPHIAGPLCLSGAISNKFRLKKTINKVKYLKILNIKLII
jgi:hypothetical protein